MRIATLFAVLVLAGCSASVRIDDVNPDMGNPYQRVFVLHTWGLQ